MLQVRDLQAPERGWDCSPGPQQLCSAPQVDILGGWAQACCEAQAPGPSFQKPPEDAGREGRSPAGVHWAEAERGLRGVKADESRKVWVWGPPPAVCPGTGGAGDSISHFPALQRPVTVLRDTRERQMSVFAHTHAHLQKTCLEGEGFSQKLLSVAHLFT